MEKRNTLHVSDEDTEIESANDTGKVDSLEESAQCKKSKSRLSKNISRKASCDSLQNTELPIETSTAPVEKAEEQVVIDKSKVSKLMEKAVEVTNGWSVEKLEELYTGLYRLINCKINDWVRTDLEKDIAIEIEKFERNNKRSR
ncbi:hypothetical protein B4U80_07234 [Leptotrombidium deliense]|uniref:Uncharacterized protein n=1 Tax=Leptotrombidium deliense TaxID=299467 RepID=A0A443SM84_9ACAR|nr:hypothetical protein B4U80_07234 [Leptotrombidium deliense]